MSLPTRDCHPHDEGAEPLFVWIIPWLITLTLLAKWMVELLIRE